MVQNRKKRNKLPHKTGDRQGIDKECDSNGDTDDAGSESDVHSSKDDTTDDEMGSTHSYDDNDEYDNDGGCDDGSRIDNGIKVDTIYSQDADSMGSKVRVIRLKKNLMCPGGDRALL